MKEFFDPSRNNVVSSANNDNSTSLSLSCIPFIFSFPLIINDKISAHIKYKYGDMGSPCRQPRCKLNQFEYCPLNDTHDSGFL